MNTVYLIFNQSKNKNIKLNCFSIKILNTTVQPLYKQWAITKKNISCFLKIYGVCLYMLVTLWFRHRYNTNKLVDTITTSTTTTSITTYSLPKKMYSITLSVHTMYIYCSYTQTGNTHTLQMKNIKTISDHTKYSLTFFLFISIRLLWIKYIDNILFIITSRTKWAI